MRVDGVREWWWRVIEGVSEGGWSEGGWSEGVVVKSD